MSAKKKKPTAKLKPFKLVKMVKKAIKPTPKKVVSKSKPKKKVGVTQRPLNLFFEVVAVADAQNEAGVIVRKTVECSGPRNAVLQFEVNDPSQHGILVPGKFFEVILREVAAI